jgi:hypothetical protein
MNHGGDVFGVLGWGLRKYAWLVALFVLALGVGVPAVQKSAPEQYDATAQVGPAQALTLPKLDALPRVGETVFVNGAVAAAVRQAFEPKLPASDPVIPSRAELVAAQDNIVFTVVGHGPDPASAQHVANIAADVFSTEMNRYSSSVGSFAVQRLATRPTQPTATAGGGLFDVVLGMGAGLAAGVGMVALLLVWSRPVVDVESAKQAGSVPVLGRVVMGTSTEFTRGIPQLCRRILAGPTDRLLLAGPRQTRRERRQLTSVLTDALGWSREVVAPEPESDVNRCLQQAPTGTPGDKHRLVIINDPSQSEIASRPESSLTLLVVHEGISRSALRRQSEQHLDGGFEGIVLVRRSHRHWPAFGRRPAQPGQRRATQQGPAQDDAHGGDGARDVVDTARQPVATEGDGVLDDDEAVSRSTVAR